MATNGKPPHRLAARAIRSIRVKSVNEHFSTDARTELTRAPAGYAPAGTYMYEASRKRKLMSACGNRCNKNFNCMRCGVVKEKKESYGRAPDVQESRRRLTTGLVHGAKRTAPDNLCSCLHGQDI